MGIVPAIVSRHRVKTPIARDNTGMLSGTMAETNVLYLYEMLSMQRKDDVHGVVELRHRGLKRIPPLEQVRAANCRSSMSALPLCLCFCLWNLRQYVVLCSALLVYSKGNALSGLQWAE